MCTSPSIIIKQQKCIFILFVLLSVPAPHICSPRFDYYYYFFFFFLPSWMIQSHHAYKQQKSNHRRLSWYFEEEIVLCSVLCCVVLCCNVEVRLTFLHRGTFFLCLDYFLGLPLLRLGRLRVVTVR